MENVATEEFIRRTEALKDFESCNAENPNWTPQRVKTLLLRQPAADVAEVVRCKDCKHRGWVQEPCHGKSVDYCKIWDCTLQNLESTFCSYGERRENA